MEGAGGIKALNYTYNVAPQDGTVVVTPTTGIVATAVLEPVQVKYDIMKFNYLGGWGEAATVLTVINTAPVKTLEEALKTEVVLGAIGKGTSSYQVPALLNDLLGTKFKIITGYQGGSPIRLAMERGEVHGWAGLWLGWRAIAQDWIRDKKLVHLFQMASKRQKDLADVPLLTEFARNDEQRTIFGLVSNMGLTGQMLVAPPNVPPARLAALEKAYLATLDDPAFRKEAEDRNYPIDPLTAAEVRAAVEQIAATPPQILAKAKKAMGM
jgi:tripartite-type tricarboxylate transporter receptor subunit TctC